MEITELQLAEVVYRKVKSLPELAQKEVLDFVEYLQEKTRGSDGEWSLTSLATALRGLESDEWPDYRPEDLEERWR